MTVQVSVITTSSLGDRSYLAHDGEVAVVVDPQRDVDRVLALAGRLGVRVTHVVETHLHNDYVSGGRQLAQLTGARYLLADAERADFDRTPVTDGDVLPVSHRMRLRAVATPGHTFHHLSYVLDTADDGGWSPAGVFTGGSLLFGTTGRPDLLGPQHAHDLARHQHASARRLADLLPDGAEVWPTHGFGSFCSATQADAPESTIGREKQVNPVLRLAAEEFVSEILAGLDAYPAYYAHMGVANAAGPAPVDLTPATRADAAELRDRIAAGQWVVDLRNRKAYAATHLAGTVSLGLDGPMSTWLGWLIDWGVPVTLLAETPEQLADAQRELVRIGIDRPAAAATGAPAEWAADPADLRQLPTADFAALAAAQAGRTPDGLPAPDVVLDVRMTNEWRAGHLAGAVHLPLPDLPKRLAEVPAGTVWVHCGSGYRATAAASLLANAGRRVVVIDDRYAAAGSAGLPIVHPA
ncbi:MBL fold metallo-hydrolase [Micromonospora sp. C28SCA-DRY-2]|uniref:MBL fold metallo-hydrolase n=1 Tax=Micromonospora sp. C28SCA-DRY-2 TaxID=3059522 RepID=UPI0026758029|nr:MBL fold metallo-hydrolase [Micromonospora sp. C28SCA-DRY-2]MDO3704379.1 MBL fold metallo-hydrolase [Micromonospora sp. C28SCA-DRY-2]